MHRLPQLFRAALERDNGTMSYQQFKKQLMRFKRAIDKGTNIVYENGSSRAGQLILPSRAAKKKRYEHKLLSHSFTRGKPDGPRASNGSGPKHDHVVSVWRHGLMVKALATAGGHLGSILLAQNHIRFFSKSKPITLFLLRLNPTIHIRSSTILLSCSV